MHGIDKKKYTDMRQSIVHRLHKGKQNFVACIKNSFAVTDRKHS